MAAAVLGSDFELIKAGGKKGDKKSDGRCISTETIYQCYAPESPKTFASNAADKIKDSFPEVTTFWPNLEHWIFVHNNLDGIPTSASDAIEEVRAEHPNISITAPPPRRFLKDNFHDKLSLQQLLDIYPKGAFNFGGVKMENIRPLLRTILHDDTFSSLSADFGENPDQSKLDHNELSAHCKDEVNRARPYVDIVDRYVDGMNKPQNATMLQTKMRSKYEELRDLGYTPDEIMGEMRNYVGADGNPTVNAAAQVIVTYYFDACDIFENVPEVSKC